MPAIPPQMQTFNVSTDGVTTLNRGRIEAAYYVVEEGFTTFKDSEHKVVYAIRNDKLLSIERTTQGASSEVRE